MNEDDGNIMQAEKDNSVPIPDEKNKERHGRRRLHKKDKEPVANSKT